MSLSKQFFTYLFLAILSTSTFAQTGWTTCNTNPGVLTGTTTSILPTDSTPLATFVSPPSPTSTIPNTEFVVMLNDSIASDSMGFAIIGTSIDGRVSPMNMGLSVGDSFSIAAFSYDIQQIKLIVHGIFNNQAAIPPIAIPCCTFFDNIIPNFCTNLNAMGISDSSDINDLNDVMTFVAAFAPGRGLSLAGLSFILTGISDSTIAGLGCTYGINICHAADSISSNHDHYVVTTGVNTTKIAGNDALQTAISPNPFKHTITAKISSKTSGKHNIQVLDAMGKVVHQKANNWAAGTQTLNLDLSHLSAGLYYLRITNPMHVVTQKIIKQ
ncbi:T9SS type A sorting domain-containing protein [Aureispira anguillae]|uniref:T9SS type A sorting domain-containing protein n=1 Tax=Aureispira anguillae TaxID=2864201 RepID=A0A916DUZ8_9BACT|nr:T9SS type A sorting domain-containing protein [Aureispira anguillae]BDS13197.1 T9SS type A sorting domain-containing protein [Aureispira anguillae]